MAERMSDLVSYVTRRVGVADPAEVTFPELATVRLDGVRG
jgi:hypothetical protein